MKKFLGLFFSIIFANQFVFASDLTIRQFPESPREGEEVKLTLESDKYNLNIANITWSVDGQESDSGVGRKTLSLKAPTNGLAQIILAKVSQEGFNDDQIQKALEANTNFILYEGVDSYVPSFYKGRRLPTKEGTVRAAFFSFKDGQISGFNDFSKENYSWKINGEDKHEYSGTGKILNTMQTSIMDSSVNLKISKRDANQNIKSAETNIPLQKTEVLVYKTDEKKLLKQVLSDTETGKKIYLFVEPFFFSISNKKDTRLLYDWKINDVATKISTPWSVVFSGKERDSVKINLDIANKEKVTQENSRGFTFKVQ